MYRMVYMHVFAYVHLCPTLSLASLGYSTHFIFTFIPRQNTLESSTLHFVKIFLFLQLHSTPLRDYIVLIQPTPLFRDVFIAAVNSFGLKKKNLCQYVFWVSSQE